MTQPISIDIPHTLGRDGARARIEQGTGKLAEFVPGGAITEQRWDGDTLHLTVEALGQRVASRIAVAEATLHAEFDLPPMLALFADRIRDKLARDVPTLLE
ncbi:polyhydroxyalkanoic acid system family protein [Sphingomonas sp.]|uniref:polyhydroxyalkanoic acid system family protein n=1 Tax=Sphingomonas sp. TaxID=28214 RepID=UPI002D1A0583|nr:polyhydroxyalkanoic acid system family protein [Sphingomonas sp.]HWK35407.1 polyhydroxyalkanoic acid system family protein [Sphingomonas sp.]